MKNTVLFILTCFGLMTGCEEANDWENSRNSEPTLVVEALLTNENIRHKVRLSETYQSLDGSPLPVSDAIVAINDGEQTMFLRQDPSHPGDYLTDTVRALFGKKYTLFVRHNRTDYYAQATAAFGSPLDPLTIEETADGQRKFVYTESESPSMTEVIVRWAEPSGNNVEVQKETIAFFYTLDVIDVNRIFAPNKEPFIFAPEATLIRRKYSLTKDHQEFLRSYLSEVDWRGGIFDVAPGNVVTNMTNGALGYFSVSMIESDTTIFN